MGGARKLSRKVLLWVSLFGLLTAGLVSCTALPRGSVDPVELILGLPRAEKGPAQPPSGMPVPAKPLGPQ